MNTLTPIESAKIAAYVYRLIETSPSALINRGDTLGCEGLFKVDDQSRMTGKTGGYVFRRLSGIGYISEGESSRPGEILVATRGTKIMADLITDLHAGLITQSLSNP